MCMFSAAQRCLEGVGFYKPDVAVSGHEQVDAVLCFGEGVPRRYFHALDYLFCCLVVDIYLREGEGRGVEEGSWGRVEIREGGREGRGVRREGGREGEWEKRERWKERKEGEEGKGRRWKGRRWKGRGVGKGRGRRRGREG